MNKSIFLAAFCLLVSFATVNASALELGKPVAVLAPSNNNSHKAGAANEVFLMNIQLNSDERNALFHLIPEVESTGNLNGATPDLNKDASRLPPAVNLGMNGVPVLDQGYHGSCVTFASTAALDAALGKGDYISQLCQLELGSYLESEGYMPSGWEGSFSPWVLDQMFRFGVITKAQQQNTSCAGLKDYPLKNQSSKGNPMSEVDYKALSENLLDKGYAPIYLLSVAQRLSKTVPYTEDDANRNVASVKQALAKGDRVIFGVIMLTKSSCFVGACAKNRVPNDTWALSKEVYTNGPTGGHEMVIFGYDDNMIAVDAQGKKHRGLFLLRNSWGSDLGDNGNFYMSYDYFKVFADEIVILAHAPNL